MSTTDNDTKVLVRRRDINLYEEQAWTDSFGQEFKAGWFGSLSGYTSTGERVSFSRRDDTIKGVLGQIEAEIASLGWEFAS